MRSWYALVSLFCLEPLRLGVSHCTSHTGRAYHAGRYRIPTGLVFSSLHRNLPLSVTDMDHISVAFCIYLFLAAEFLLRYHYDKPFSRAAVAPPPKRLGLDRGVKLMIGGLALDALWILIRSIYRTVVSIIVLSVKPLLTTHYIGIGRRLVGENHCYANLLQ